MRSARSYLDGHVSDLAKKRSLPQQQLEQLGTRKEKVI
jgi:hypothetical protein